MRVKQANRLKHHVEGNHNHDGRQDPLRDHPEQNIAIAKRHPEMAAKGAGQEEEHGQRHGRGHPPWHAGIGGCQNDPNDQQHENHDVAEFRSVLDPCQRIGRH